MSKPTPRHKTPLTIRRIQITMLVCVVVIGGLFFAWQRLAEFFVDPVLDTPIDTKGWVAAVRYDEGSSRAVVIQADGKLRESPGWNSPNRDLDVTWHPNGHWVFFSSDREENQGFNIYRWTLANDKAQARSAGSRSAARPQFWSNDKEVRDLALVSSGGTINELNSRTGARAQILPPAPTAIGLAEEGGATGQIEAAYKQLGTSFREAVYGPNRETVFAVMRGEEGEVLIVQRIAGFKSQEPGERQPMPIIAAEEIQLDGNRNGEVVYTARNMRPRTIEERRAWADEKGRVIPPFRHVVGVVKFNDAGEMEPGILLPSKDDTLAFDAPAISPDGSRMAVVSGAYADGVSFKAQRIVLLPLDPNGGLQPVALVSGDVANPAWGPGSDQLAYVRRGDSGGAIYLIGVDGSGEKKVSPDGGDYDNPVISPQSP